MVRRPTLARLSNLVRHESPGTKKRDTSCPPVRLLVCVCKHVGSTSPRERRPPSTRPIADASRTLKCVRPRRPRGPSSADGGKSANSILHGTRKRSHSEPAASRFRGEIFADFDFSPVRNQSRSGKKVRSAGMERRDIPARRLKALTSVTWEIGGLHARLTSAGQSSLLSTVFALPFASPDRIERPSRPHKSSPIVRPPREISGEMTTTDDVTRRSAKPGNGDRSSWKPNARMADGRR